MTPQENRDPSRLGARRRTARWSAVGPLSAAALLAACLLSRPAGADSEVSARGQVFAAGGTTPVSGATVKLYHLATGTLYSAPPTGEDGEFVIKGVLPGSYDLAVETGRGLWLSDRMLALQGPGEHTVSVALRERAYWEGAQRMPERQSPLGEEFVGLAVILSPAKGSPLLGMSTGGKVGIGAAIGGGLLLLLALSGGGGDQQPASPFMP